MLYAYAYFRDKCNENLVYSGAIIANKIDDIANMDNLLYMMRDIATCTNGKGIGLDMDMVFFGIIQL